ncbi:Endonuclease/exonuclease/phosphatase, partial [Mycena floridula]
RPTNCKKNTRAAIKVAAINIRGNGHINPNHPSSRWNHVNQLMRDKRIGILIAGEARLNEDRHKRLKALFLKRLKIWYSKDPMRNAKGIAVVFNKELTNVEDVQVREIIPGQALLVTTNWHGNEKLTILAVYATNDSHAENAAVWIQIEEFFLANPDAPKPNMLAGDLNMVEDEIDRLPPRFETSTAVTDAFDSMKGALKLKDGWRDTYPDTFDFTYTHTNGHKSRLDRIYVSQETLDHSQEWLIETPDGINTDHLMVSTVISCKAAPQIGRGRWNMPRHLFKDKKVLEEVKAAGCDALQQILDQHDTGKEWNPEYNAQTIFNEFKKKMRKIVRKRAKAVMPRLQRQIEDLADARQDILNNRDLSKEERMDQSARVEQRLRELTAKKHQKSRASVRFRNQMEAETMTGSWTK